MFVKNWIFFFIDALTKQIKVNNLSCIKKSSTLHPVQKELWLLRLSLSRVKKKHVINTFCYRQIDITNVQRICVVYTRILFQRPLFIFLLLSKFDINQSCVHVVSGEYFLKMGRGGIQCIPPPPSLHPIYKKEMKVQKELECINEERGKNILEDNMKIRF